MSKPRIAHLAGVLYAALASTGVAQTREVLVYTPSPFPQTQLGPVQKSSERRFKSVTLVRELSDGRVLVLDVSGRHVVLLDRDLALVKVVADSTPETGNAFSARYAGMIPYNGDSTLFIDPTAYTMLVLDPAGNVARVMATPTKATDAVRLAAGIFGMPAFDGMGRLVYPAWNSRAPTEPCTADGMRPMPQTSDSSAIVAVDLVTRKVDTIRYIRRQPTYMQFSMRPSPNVQPAYTPLTLGDDWAVLSDGSIAIIRGLEYQVERISMDGKHTVGPKASFSWRQLGDSGKTIYVNQTVAAIQRNTGNSRRVEVVNGPSATAWGPLFGPCAPNITLPTLERPPALLTAADTLAWSTPFYVVGQALLPTYIPPFTPGVARADLDAHLWVRTSAFLGGEQMYDVFDAGGVLVDRVRVPVDRVIVGFGKGTVYTATRDSSGVRLERLGRKPVP